MNRNRAINNITDLGDLNKIKLSDLAIRFRTGQAVANGIGRAKCWSYRHGISCALGDVESDMWMSAAAIKVIEYLVQNISIKLRHLCISTDCQQSAVRTEKSRYMRSTSV